ncbi:MAG: DNA polymerase I [Myxococcales bacterium]|nr:DNA polymerase I [Myxococcales bacterium]
MANKEKLYLIDGSGYIFRAFYGIRPLTTSTGIPTNAVVGFARMLLKLLRTEEPKHLAIAFDTPEPTFRHKIYDHYKANRDAPPEDLIPQFALIHEFVETLNIPVLKLGGYEADDIIATLCKNGLSENYEVTVVSGDKDLMQLVSSEVALFDPMKDKFYGREDVQEYFGVYPEHVLDVLALAGDSSDNIPGVPKIGKKSAAKLILEFGHIPEIVVGLGSKEKLKAFEKSLLENVDLAELSLKLATLDDNVPLEEKIKDLFIKEPNQDALRAFLQKIESNSLLESFNLNSSDDSAAPASGANNSGSTIDRSAYKTILQEKELNDLIKKIKSVKRISIDLETTSIEATQADILGVALCLPDSPACYIPLAHEGDETPQQLAKDATLKALKPILEDPKIEKIGQNLKYEINTFARAGIDLVNAKYDSMLIAYCLDPGRTAFNLDALAREELGHKTITYKELTGTGKSAIPFAQVPIAEATTYAAEDADIALRLTEKLLPKMSETKLQALYDDIELPLMAVLARMESNGVLLDTAALETFAEELEGRIHRLEQDAYAIIGKEINLGSTKQLAEVFFNELGYPVIKKTKTGYSTDQEVLETLARDYELPEIILSHRLLRKLKSTYVDALPKLVNQETGRLHTHFNQTGTATGRLSSSNPNLQNIPIRTEDGRRIRKAIIAPPGWQLISADYSQIELRMLAHLCADEGFVSAFNDGIDIHTQTARQILSAGEEPTSEMRRQAKAINFGILYGLTEFGLAKQLNISRAEAKSFIEAYFSKYPAIRDFLEESIEFARKNGYVTTIMGRQRYLPTINSQNKNIRQAAERIAMNTPIQGSAADLIKMAMLNIDRQLQEQGLKSKLILQVHDELIIEAPDAEKDMIVDLMKNEMSGVMQLKVPLEIDIDYGNNWDDAH